MEERLQVNERTKQNIEQQIKNRQETGGFCVFV